MTSTVYITDLALALAAECDKYTIPVGRPGFENALEILILIDALTTLNQSLRKITKLLDTSQE